MTNSLQCSSTKQQWALAGFTLGKILLICSEFSPLQFPICYQWYRGIICISCTDFVSSNFFFLIHFLFWIADSLGFFHYSLPTNIDDLTFPSLPPFISFSCLTPLARTSLPHSQLVLKFKKPSQMAFCCY